MTRWLLSWKTQATLAVLAGLLVVVSLLLEPVSWSTVVTGLLVMASSGWLAVVYYRAQSRTEQEDAG